MLSRFQPLSSNCTIIHSISLQPGYRNELGLKTEVQGNSSEKGGKPGADPGFDEGGFG